MCEILGAVAGGLALAEFGLKVGGTVWKLKKLWQEVYEVPATIQELMRQIEIMDPVLSDHETTLRNQSTALPRQLPTHNTQTAVLSAAYCREALDGLRRLVEDLDSAIESEKRSRRTFAKMRVVMLKKDTIKEFQDRLERAVRLLQSTQVSYLVANATIMRTMVADMWTSVTDMQAQLSNSNPSSSTRMPPFPIVTQRVGVSQEHTLETRKRFKCPGHGITFPWSGPSFFGAIIVKRSEADCAGEQTYAARIQLPNWLSQKVWDLSINRACSGWQVSLSTWNIVPKDSPGMLRVADGDLHGLLDLFNRGLASPRDCDVHGQTIFKVGPIEVVSRMGFAVDQIKVACRLAQTCIVNHFINTNLDQWETTPMDIWTAEEICGGTMPIDVVRKVISRNSFDSRANAVESVEPYDQGSWSFRQHSNVFCLSWTAQKLELLGSYVRTHFPSWSTFPPRRKQDVLMSTLPFVSWTANNLRFMICPDGPIRPVEAKAWNDDGVSLLHVIIPYYLMEVYEDHAGDFEILLEEAIQATDDVHYMQTFKPRSLISGIGESCSAFQVALMSLLHYSLNPGRRITRGSLERLTTALQSLMSVFASCGHDLLGFGRKEADIWVKECNTRRVVGDALYLGFRYCGVREVRAIHYGAEPKDWCFELDFHYEDYAGAFWNLIENPHLFMVPGTWVDEEWDSD